MSRLNNHGQALVEYVLIVSIISVITIAIVSYFGGYLKDAITKTSCSLAEEVYVEGKKPGEATCQKEKEE
jgi:Flp pilus assembly pilin Flp